MRKDNILKSIKILLPTVFILYFICITFFTHSHVVNGVTIVHSHPYKSDQNGNPMHEHTGSEIQLIQFLTSFHSVSLDIPHFEVRPVETEITAQLPTYFEPQIKVSLEGLERLRPPPISL